VSQQLALGTYEDAKAEIGRMRQVLVSTGPVNEAMIKYFASACEDGNPSFWNDDFAASQWGAVVTPPAMLVHWVLPPPWSPGEDSSGHLAPPILLTKVPLPGDTLINVSVDYTYHRPVLAGERLHAVEELVDVSEEKATRLGVGHFVTTAATFLTTGDEVVATQVNVGLRYLSGGNRD
jgi:acyl dehydratase